MGTPAETQGLVTPITQTRYYEDLSSALYIIGAKENALLANLGTAPDASAWKHEFVEDEYRSNKLTFGASISAGATSITVPTADCTKYRANEKFRIDQELILTTARSTVTLTVLRAQAGTSAAAHTSADIVILLGRNVVDGGDFPSAHTTVKTRQYNVVETLDTPLAVTDISMMTDQPGGQEFTGQSDKQMVEHIADINYEMLYGERQDDAASTRRYMGGIIPWLSTNCTAASGTDTTTAALTQAILENWLSGMYENGGDPDLLICNPRAAVVLRAFVETRMEVSQVGPAEYGIYVTKWHTPFATKPLQILMTKALDARTGRTSSFQRANAKGVIVALDRRYLKVSWLRTAGEYMGRTHVEDIAKTGHSKRACIVSHLTLERRAEKCHGLLMGFHTSG